MMFDGLLMCTVCGSNNVMLTGKTQHILHTDCLFCGMSSRPMVEAYNSQNVEIVRVRNKHIDYNDKTR